MNHDPGLTHVAIGGAAGATLLALLLLRSWRGLRAVDAARHEVAAALAARAAQSLVPVECVLEAPERGGVVVVGWLHGDPLLHWDPEHLTAHAFMLRSRAGFRVPVPDGAPVLAIGLPSAIQEHVAWTPVRTEVRLPAGTAVWTLLSCSGDSPRLPDMVEISESRSRLELAPPPQHRVDGEAFAWLTAALGATAAAPLVPGMPPWATASGTVLLFGLAFVALMSALLNGFDVDVDVESIRDDPLHRCLLRAVAPWPARWQVRPPARGTWPPDVTGG